MSGMHIKLKAGQSFTPKDGAFTVTNEQGHSIRITIKKAKAEVEKDKSHGQES